MSFKKICAKIGVLTVLGFFVQCACSQKIDQAAPITTEGIYFQDWVAGVQGGGAGFNIFIPVPENVDIQLTEVYFKGKKILLKLEKNNTLYIGRYTDPKINSRDLIMSRNPKDEFKNKVPIVEKKIPFELKGNECIIGYTKKGKKGYFKIDNLSEKEIVAYPSAPRQ